MTEKFLFSFKTDISKVNVPTKLNNPFESNIPEIARIAAEEFQEFLKTETLKWKGDYINRPGKMFGVLVIRNEDETYNFTGTVSGKLYDKDHCERFVPTPFDDSKNDFFLDKGMSSLTDLGSQIKNSEVPSEIKRLKEKRKQKSIGLQKYLFENYHFLNTLGEVKNVLQISEDSGYGKPSSAAGECAAPKLLQFAFKHNLKPIAIAEFWWGKATTNKEREHMIYYPACTIKCRPILEYMLDDSTLFDQANSA